MQYERCVMTGDTWIGIKKILKEVHAVHSRVIT